MVTCCFGTCLQFSPCSTNQQVDFAPSHPQQEEIQYYKLQSQHPFGEGWFHKYFALKEEDGKSED